MFLSWSGKTINSHECGEDKLFGRQSSIQININRLEVYFIIGLRRQITRKFAYLSENSFFHFLVLFLLLLIIWLALIRARSKKGISKAWVKWSVAPWKMWLTSTWQNISSLSQATKDPLTVLFYLRISFSVHLSWDVTGRRKAAKQWATIRRERKLLSKILCWFEAKSFIARLRLFRNKTQTFLNSIKLPS